MKEYEIRPQELLEKYIELSVQDAEKYFSNDVRKKLPCVACEKELTIRMKYALEIK